MNVQWKESENANLFFSWANSEKVIRIRLPLFIEMNTVCTAWHSIAVSISIQRNTSCKRERSSTSIYVCYQSRNCHPPTCGRIPFDCLQCNKWSANRAVWKCLQLQIKCVCWIWCLRNFDNVINVNRTQIDRNFFSSFIPAIRSLPIVMPKTAQYFTNSS